jgi:hypothetical protein
LVRANKCSTNIVREHSRTQVAALLGEHEPFPLFHVRGTLIRRGFRNDPGGSCRSATYIIPIFTDWQGIMEAEQLNQVANRLTDIAQRASELRRYL